MKTRVSELVKRQFRKFTKTPFGRGFIREKAEEIRGTLGEEVGVRLLSLEVGRGLAILKELVRGERETEKALKEMSE